MDTLELSGPQGWLKILCRVVDKAKSPMAAKGYQHLHYMVGGHGFSGEGDGFVAEEELRHFCKALIELIEGRYAEPRLISGEAGGLALSLRRQSEHSHVSVEGSIVRKVYRDISDVDKGTYIWATHFGFPVMLNSLSKAREVRWVLEFLG